MTTFCLPGRTPIPMLYNEFQQRKMDRCPSEEQDTPRSPGIPIRGIVTANENWRGKNDPAERRRIQNRLNQRAFRERQRSGTSPKQYKARRNSSQSQQEEDSEDDDSDSSESESSSQPSRRLVEGRVWDELAQLINRNFMAAAVANAQHLGVDLSALQAGSSIRTPRPEDRQVPASLTPVELQYQLPHDPIIDTFPHARLRYNILHAIATRRIDATAFLKCVRASGALEESNGGRQRGGVVVWSFPEQVASWELSEPFVRRWAVLLQGCEDLIAATNAWRSRRGERSFPISLTRSDEMLRH